MVEYGVSALSDSDSHFHDRWSGNDERVAFFALALFRVWFRPFCLVVFRHLLFLLYGVCVWQKCLDRFRSDASSAVADVVAVAAVVVADVVVADVVLRVVQVSASWTATPFARRVTVVVVVVVAVVVAVVGGVRSIESMKIRRWGRSISSASDDTQQLPSFEKKLGTRPRPSSIGCSRTRTSANRLRIQRPKRKKERRR